MFPHLICRNQQFSRNIFLKLNNSVLKSNTKVYYSCFKPDARKWPLFGFKPNLNILKIRSVRYFANARNGSNAPKTQMSATEIVRKLFRFVWPKDNRAIKIRVTVAMSLLLAAKLLSVAVPILFKQIVDFLNKNVNIKDESTQAKILYSVIALIIGYGAARAG
jgi:hypothetical protein